MGPTRQAPFPQTLRRHRINPPAASGPKQPDTFPLFPAPSPAPTSRTIMWELCLCHSSSLWCFKVPAAPQKSHYNQMCGWKAVWRDVGSPGLMDDVVSEHLHPEDAVLYSYTLMPSIRMHLWIHFVWLLGDSQSQQFDGGRNFHGNSWCVWIGPSAATICFTLGHTDQWNRRYLNLSFYRIPFLSRATVLLPKKTRFMFSVSNLFSPLLLFLYVLCLYSC